jgi:hypothetical protein
VSTDEVMDEVTEEESVTDTEGEESEELDFDDLFSGSARTGEKSTLKDFASTNVILTAITKEGDGDSARYFVNVTDGSGEQFERVEAPVRVAKPLITMLQSRKVNLSKFRLRVHIVPLKRGIRLANAK